MFQIGAAGTDPLKDNLRSNFNSFKKKFNSNIFFQYYSTLGTQNFIYIHTLILLSFLDPQQSQCRDISETLFTKLPILFPSKKGGDLTTIRWKIIKHAP